MVVDRCFGIGCIDENYSYNWSYELDSEFNPTDEDITGLYAGVYNLVVTTASGASNSISIEVPFYTPSDWNINESLESHQIIVPQDVNILIDETPITYGDYIAVADLNGNIGGMMMWNGQLDVLNAYGSVFSQGDIFSWLIWDSSTDTYYAADAVYDESYPDTEAFAIGGESGITDLVARTLFMQQIDLPAGWGLYSTFISSSEDIETVFNDITDNLIQQMKMVIYFGQH